MTAERDMETVTWVLRPEEGAITLARSGVEAAHPPETLLRPEIPAVHLDSPINPSVTFSETPSTIPLVEKPVQTPIVGLLKKHSIAVAATSALAISACSFVEAGTLPVFAGFATLIIGGEIAVDTFVTSDNKKLKDSISFVASVGGAIVVTVASFNYPVVGALVIVVEGIMSLRLLAMKIFKN